MQGLNTGTQTLSLNSIAFAACGTSCGLLMVNAVSVCWLHGLAPCFQIHENKTRTKVHEDGQCQWHPKLCCTVAKTSGALHCVYDYLAKKSPHNSFLFACVLMHARFKWESASHVVCIISIKIERQLITFCTVLTPASWDLPNMRSIKKKIKLKSMKIAYTYHVW